MQVILRGQSEDVRPVCAFFVSSPAAAQGPVSKPSLVNNKKDKNAACAKW